MPARTARDLVQALITGLDRETLLALNRACEAQSDALNHADRVHPSPDLREDASRLRVAALTFATALAQFDTANDAAPHEVMIEETEDGWKADCQDCEWTGRRQVATAFTTQDPSDAAWAAAVADGRGHGRVIG